MVVAILALVLSVLSIGWQAWTWKNSGPVVKVRVFNAVTDAATGEAENYLAVEAVNTGRAAATVTGWGIRLPDGGSIHKLHPLPISSTLPHRLEPQDKATFFIESDAVREQHHARNVAFEEMRPWVDLGTGKRVDARKAVPLLD